MANYKTEIFINTDADKVYDALTQGIPNWWTQLLEGASSRTNDIFTVRFGDAVFKKLQVVELLGNSKIVWSVLDSKIDIPELHNKTEWISTTISWEIKERNNGLVLMLTHIGLHPDLDCYTICSDGWKQFTDSLKLYLESGKGKPFLQPE